MSYPPHELSLRIRLEPDKVRDVIVAAFEASGANLKSAAARLGVEERTIHRYVVALKLQRTLEAIRVRARREGWLKSARWPEKATPDGNRGP